MKFISSSNNPEIKLVSNFLSNPGSTKFKNFFFLEGEKLVREAINSGLKLKSLFFLEGKENLFDNSAQINHSVIVPLKIMKKITSLASPPPVVGLFLNRPEVSFKKLLSNGSTFIFLDRIQDPGNLGTIIRSADGFGIDGIFTSTGCCSISNPKLVRSAMGSIFHTPILEIEDFDEFKNTLDQHQIELVASDMGGISLYEIQLPQKVMFVFGNEGMGISPDIDKHCKKKLGIPMPGLAESFNVSIAASIFLYERRRNFPKAIGKNC
ncbi:MAG: RNA methyltransferase [Candidatus Riflebacteria bacterium]|nr:RNA methyltransferase [Candidatus Riflebacteria bacterium]